MIIESCITEYMNTSGFDNPNPLLVGQYPPIDTLVFEPSDLIIRPVINYYTVTPIHYVLHLHFTDYSTEIRSSSKPLIRYVLSCILADVDVLESDIRRHFPEMFL